jgi:ferrous iron transport protein B
MHKHSNAVELNTTSTDGFFIALVGSPNSGKTTLYNQITSSSHSTVNYPGSTVDYSYGMISKKYGDEDFFVLDTPGTYSLFPKSPDEKVTTDIIYHYPDSGFAKVVIATVDLSQLSRQLWIVYQLLEAKFQVIVALTMRDMFTLQEKNIDLKELERKIGCPVMLVSGLTGDGVKELVDKVKELRKTIPQKPVEIQPWPQQQKQQVYVQMNEVDRLIHQQNHEYHQKRDRLHEQTRALDRIFLHPVLGLVIFVLLMFGLFSSVFWAAAPLMDFVDGLFSGSADWILGLSEGSLWTDFLGNGIVASMGAVLVFVPQIAILFLGITLLEDSGYLARACSLIDKPLSMLGMNGRSFVPLLSANACAIPAMMAARTISSPKEKFLTLFIIPLMSCSARLPVYALLLSFLFWEQPAWKAGIALSFIYFVSLFVGGVAATIMNRIVKFPETSFFIHELPIYRRPHFRTVFKNVWDKTLAYIKKAGPIIFVLAALIWVFTTFPNYNAPTDIERLNDSYAAKAGKIFEPVMKPMGGDWRTGTALISAFAAREVFVASLSLVLNLSEEESEDQNSLLQKMNSATLPDGSPLFTVSSVIGLIVFVMIALQCISTIGVARREFGSWKIPLIQLVVFNLVAYALAVFLVQCLRSIGVS